MEEEGGRGEGRTDGRPNGGGKALRGTFKSAVGCGRRRGEGGERPDRRKGAEEEGGGREGRTAEQRRQGVTVFFRIRCELWTVAEQPRQDCPVPPAPPEAQHDDTPSERLLVDDEGRGDLNVVGGRQQVLDGDQFLASPMHQRLKALPWQRRVIEEPVRIPVAHPPNRQLDPRPRS